MTFFLPCYKVYCRENLHIVAPCYFWWFHLETFRNGKYAATIKHKEHIISLIKCIETGFFFVILFFIE